MRVTYRDLHYAVISNGYFQGSHLWEAFLVASTSKNCSSCPTPRPTDNEQKVGHTISEAALFRFLLNEENLKRQIDEAEAGIPKMLNVLKDVDKNWEIKEFETHQSSMGSAKTWFNAFHVFIVFKTTSETDGVYWWSLEKGLDYITLQRSRKKENVKDKLKGKQRTKAKPITDVLKGKGTIKDLFAILWANQIIPGKYNIVKSNCQSLVTFIGQQTTEIGYNYEGYFPYYPPPGKGRDKKILELINVITGCSDDWSPLFQLIKMGSTDLVNITVAIGKYDINIDTPLHLAAHEKEIETISLILENEQVDINSRGNYGQTALHHAIRFRMPNTARYLLKKGADPNAATENGATPLYLAAKTYYHYMTNTELIDIILETGKCNINGVDNYGRTPLHYAIEGYIPGTINVRRLIKMGADPGIADKKGVTPLHMSAKIAKSLDLIDELLLKVKTVAVDVNGVDKQGLTPFAYAQDNKHGLGRSIIDRLKEYGAKN
ncbi:alpha-latrocrustotoxin-Lt1a-like [Daphnia pulicaria]|uniref:alpha-latrocrustotoxin-Lt1a-like n=1 Tax=Daphnia pulicaria TaxID=35523 RepID=UPI001EEB75A6|nr:alpha-latrocrustotoxin-Lt1a-like [Daphnia pulicaria]